MDPNKFQSDLRREAEDLGQASPTFSARACANAKLAYLYSLILDDRELIKLKPDLTKLAGHPLVAAENVQELEKTLHRPARAIGIDSHLLAVSAICWANEAEEHPYEVKGSADWYALPVQIQATRAQLREEARELSTEIESALAGQGLDPDSALRLCIGKCKQLGTTLRNLEKEIQGLEVRRSALLSNIHKYHIETFYLKRVRKKRIDSSTMERLVNHANASAAQVRLDMTKRVKVQKTLYDWATAAERNLDAIVSVWSSDKVGAS